MKISFVVNNFQLGAKVKMTPVDKIISQQRLDKGHTEIVYELDSKREQEFCEKVLARKGKVIEERELSLEDRLADAVERSGEANKDAFCRNELEKS